MGRPRKKKIADELRRYYPGYFSEGEAMEFYAKIKARIAALAAGDEAKVLETDRFFAEYNKPSCFDDGDPDNAVVLTEKTFQNLCAVLESNGVAHAATLTVLEFYGRLDYYRRQNEAMIQAMKKPAV